VLSPEKGTTLRLTVGGSARVGARAVTKEPDEKNEEAAHTPCAASFRFPRQACGAR
jgi:hypothetical protein